jgi:uncharacterized Ntn-hydrolase superfamily protein
MGRNSFFPFSLSSYSHLSLFHIILRDMLFPRAFILVLVAFHGGALGTPLKSASAKTGAVASESKVCSTIGADVLQEGGNAADAVRRSFSDDSRRSL